MPTVTVVVPIHNAAKYLDRALVNLASIQAANIEILVIDDHSTDASKDIVARWPELQNIRILSSGARGVAGARNQAAEAAKGDYLWFADCDDDWDAQVVSSMLSEALATDADVVVANATKILVPGGRAELIEDAPRREAISGTEALQRLLTGAIQGHLWNKLFARRLFDRAIFPPTRAHSDLGGMFSLLARARTVALLPESHYSYYVHEGSILNQREYRWRDLWDCLDLAEGAVASEPAAAGLKDALTVFTYRNVIVPSINESVRRESSAAPKDVTAFRKKAQHRVRFEELIWLLSHGHADAGVRAALIKFAFPIYRWVYRRHRARTWAAIDSTHQESVQH